MISESLQKIEAELRRDAACHRYPEVQRLVVSLCQAAAEQTKVLPAGDSRILEIGAWVDDLLEWTRVMLVTARASQAAELRQAYFLRGYLRCTQTAAQMSRDL
jgi:hypothetical protein